MKKLPEGYMANLCVFNIQNRGIMHQMVKDAKADNTTEAKSGPDSQCQDLGAVIVAKVPHISAESGIKRSDLSWDRRTPNQRLADPLFVLRITSA